ncbi:ATP-binding protein, partial [Roseisolibacter sp. H3M3-2]|uniref:sensor histidine kinase n=1 Tax=Roseisolibacter sp. H3M3-2 TaxID=3031323 RepID=UPI0023DA3885
WAWVRRRVERPLARVAHAVGADGATGALDALGERAADLAERLRAGEAQRARTEKMATVGRMAAGIAHEVGNPLAAINGYVHVLRARAADRPDVAPVLDALERESDRIDRIVRGLLDYARPRRITPAAVDVNEVLTGAVGLLRDQGVLRRLELRRALADPAPTVFAERHELEQVFVNLVLNAADAMDGGPGVLAVVTREVAVAELGQGGRRAGDAPDVLVPPRPNRRVTEWLSGAGSAPRAVAQIVVADSGPGIAPEDWERVFDPFYTTKDVGRGTGLGLALVARAIDQLGGAVWVQRAREGGAAFVILLPLAASADARDDAPPSFEEQLDFLRSMAR